MPPKNIWREISTPAYVIDESALQKNLALLARVQKETGANILLAQKCFSAYRLYPLIKKHLAGAASSGLFEARLAHEFMGGENHVFSPAYRDEDFDELAEICDHIVFNSCAQLKKFAARAKSKNASCGLRVNPEHSTQKCALYDPCAPNSRLGVRKKDFDESCLPLLDGLHFHTLCEQDSDALEETLLAVEEKFGAYLRRMKWINFGGGHHITRAGYDLDRLARCVSLMHEKYGLDVYLEPGEAVALNAGFLVASVLDVQGRHAIIDASAACHAPDVLEMPYRLRIIGAASPREKAHDYVLGAATCLAGDSFGEYSFDAPLVAGDRIVFEDMAIYTMVKNNTFNGMPLPSIVVIRPDGELQTLKKFGYEDFKSRL